jgi:large subunit ribosomal protein L13
MITKTTYTPNPLTAQTSRKWLLVDAKDKVLGRMAADIAAILRGKHKPTYIPHVDCGDNVIVINASQVRMTGGKEEKKIRYHHSGYPGGIKAEPYGKLLKRDPNRAIRAAVRGMLPHNDLGRLMIRKLKVYAGAEHTQQAQKPVAIELPYFECSEGVSE